MASTIAELVTDLREALSLDASYETSILPSIVRKSCSKLLRDYHFDKSLRAELYTNLPLASQSYATPVGFKKEHMLRFHDPVEDVYTLPLLKRPFRVPEPPDGQARNYWLEGSNLLTDIKLPAESVGITLELYYESMDVTANESWLVPDFEDVLFALSMYNASAQTRKTELAKIWKTKWAEERTSLAVFANELQFDNSELMMNASSSQETVTRYAFS